MRIISALCTLLLISVFTPSTTHADPLVITSGTLTVQGPVGAPHFTFSGSDFVVSGSGGDRGAVALQTGCIPCLSGQFTGVQAFFVGSSLGGGGVTVNGMSFSGGFSGTFALSGPLIQVPFSLTNLTITSPFTFIGNLNVCPDSCVTRPPVFGVSLIGSGTATFDLVFGSLNAQGVPIFTFTDVTYNFEVPEPASILLFGAGLTALSAALRHRRSSLKGKKVKHKFLDTVFDSRL